VTWLPGFRYSRLSRAGALAVAIFVLILPPAAASGGAASMSSTQVAQVTLTVSIAGTGIGVVESYPSPLTYPQGISCPSICSAQFADGTLVDLHVLTDEGSNFEGFSGCYPVYVPLPPPDGGTDCLITMDSQLGPTASVQVTFNLVCVVPGVKGRTLARAKALIRENHCGVGSVKHVFSHKVKKGRVISQNPKPHLRGAVGTAVNLVVSKGRR
jgi:hypothetical protein